MNIIKDFNNELLNRREMEFSFSSPTNPGFDGAMKKLCEKGVSEDVSVIKSIKGEYGSENFFVEAFVYNSVESKTKVEPKKKEKK